MEKVIRAAVFGLGASLVPGPDVFNFKFFQCFLNLLKPDILAVFDDFYNGNLDMFHINYVYITLASMDDGTIDIRGFCPISLIHGIHKIIMKVLVNRLASKIDQLIDPLQSAFIKNLTIMDNIASAQEIVTVCNNNWWSALCLKHRLVGVGLYSTSSSCVWLWR